jgi:hypothetical protein
MLFSVFVQGVCIVQENVLFPERYVLATGMEWVISTNLKGGPCTNP